MAENTEVFCSAAAAYLQDQLGIRVEYVTGIPWQERERLFDAGAIHILWLCGLPYVQKADRAEDRMELLAVPVPAGARYQDRPIYFSDVVVRQDSRYCSFADLRGASWAYNEPRSHSGYNVVRAHLAGLGALRGFFGAAVESGAHLNSLDWVSSSRVDASAVDSTVLQWAALARPELLKSIRVLETLGPSPIPPWVICREVPEAQRSAIRKLLLAMHLDPRGSTILAAARIKRFSSAADRDYDPIRLMDREAREVTLSSSHDAGAST